MKKKIIWLIVSCLMVALVLATCKPAPVTEKKEVKGVVKEPEKKVEEVVEKPAVGEPQYGGKLTTFANLWAQAADPASADVLDGHWTTNVWTTPHMEYLLTTDFEKYGPRGTGEFGVQVLQGIPEAFLAGQLAESWEASPDKIVFHIRKGVTWTGNANIGMEPRELTAEDVTFSLNRYYNSEKVGGPAVFPFIDSIYAEGKYTVVVKTNRYYAGWPDLIAWGNYAAIYPPEVVAAGASDWNNAVGTGPFIVKDYVLGAQVTWERNPYYWGKTTINGKEYQTPFIDKLIWPIIPDESTRIAALRTGKLDYAWGTPVQYEETLAETAPDLVKVEFYKNGMSGLALRCDREPFNNREVRRAMMIGTNLEAIRDAIWMKGRIHSFPISGGLPTTLYTPMEDLPASAQELYDYDPDKARQMLADEGYPDGFKVELVFVWEEDLADMLADQWSRFGVTAQIKHLESAAFWGALYAKDYKDCFIRGYGTAYPLRAIHELGWPDHAVNTAVYEHEYFTKQMLLIQQTIDVSERNALMKDFGVWFLEEAAYIPFADWVMLIHYWPWVKNYYGESDAANCNLAPLFATMWIDQNLKAEMGY